MNFALSHAITLAEAGISVPMKRIGYLFCTEVLPTDHELNLMLVNTLRKVQYTFTLVSLAINNSCLGLGKFVRSSYLPRARYHNYEVHTGRYSCCSVSVARSNLA